MSKSIDLILPDEVSLSIIGEHLSRRWEVDEIVRINGRKYIEISETTNPHYGISYVKLGILEPAAEIVEDYKDCDFLDIEFRNALNKHVFYIVYFNDPALCNKAIKELLSNLPMNLNECWIDNDYGKVIRADKVLANLNADPNFDWADQ